MKQLFLALAILASAAEVSAQNTIYSLGFLPAPGGSPWSGSNNNFITVTNTGPSVIPAGLTLFIENEMATSLAGRNLLPIVAPQPFTSSKVSLIPGSCVGNTTPSSYARYGCRMKLNSAFAVGETFTVAFAFTLNPGPAIAPGSPVNALNICATGWLTTPGPTWPGAFGGVGNYLQGWTFKNQWGGGATQGCLPPPPLPKDVRIKKTGTNSVGVGGQMSFTLNATNRGSGTLTNVTVTDTLPAGLTGVTISAGPNWYCSLSGLTLNCNYNGPPVGGGGPFLGPITINATASSPGNFSNCADISIPYYTDVKPGDNHSCWPYSVAPAPKKDVKIQKIGGGTVSLGSIVNFYLMPWNVGPAALGSGAITITDTLPPGLTSVTAMGTNWNCPSAGGSWTGTCTYTGPTVGAGPLPVITVQATTSLSGTFSNCATIGLPGGGDVNLSDNGPKCKNYTVNPLPIPPDLAMTKIGGGNVTAGTPITFTLTPTNIGGAVTGGIFVTDTLPNGLTPISGSGTNWYCYINTGSQTVNCIYTGPTVAQGQPFPPITIQANTVAAGAGQNCATITIFNPADVAPGNNQGCTPYNVQSLPPSVNVGITKLGGGNVIAGSQVGFTLKPINLGPDPATSVTVTDALTGLTNIAFTAPSQWTCQVVGSTLTCTYSGPPITASNYFPTIGITAIAPAAGTSQNCASIAMTGPGSDPISTNNSSCVPYNVIPPLSVSCVAATTGQLGVAYTSSIIATGGTAPYTFTITSGSLPPGLTMAAGTGVISGTPLTAGTYPFAVKVTDANGLITTTTGCGITIAPATLIAACPPGTIGQVGVPYSSTVMASGGTAPYTFSLASGILPPGLTLNATTGVISGTPATAGSFPFTIKVTDSTGGAAGTPLTVTTSSCGITIAPAPLTAFCAPATTGQVGVAYSSTVTASGGLAPYTFTLASGTLPPGLTLNATTGVISGIPTTTGSFPFSVMVADSTGGVAGTPLTATTSSCGINIAPAPLTASCAPATTGQVGVAYSSTIPASGGTAPYTFTLGSGTLPPGLTLNATTGVISGTPATAGSFSFSVKLTDSTGGTALIATTSSCGITISPAALTAACAPGTTGQVGVAFSSTVPASGGTTPYTFTLGSGTLPPGLTLNATTGVISGTPATAGSFSFSVKVTDSNGATATTANCGITVSGAPATLTIVKVALPSNDTQVFHFTTTGAGLTDADLDDDGDNTNAYADSRTYTNLTPGVTYTVTEPAVTGWLLSSIQCSPSGSSVGVVPDTLARKVFVTPAPGLNVTCTFTNFKQTGTITIRKVANPESTQAFHFSTSGQGLPAGGFYLDDDGSPTTGYSDVQTFTVPAGVNFTITEDAVSGWNLTPLSHATCNLAGVTYVYSATGINVTLNSNGASVDCTFTNTKLASLTITKVAQPNHSQDFQFTTTGSGLPPTITLDDDAVPGGPPNSVTYSVTPGVTYTVAETPVSGWMLSGIQCNPGPGSSASTNAMNASVAVNLAPGASMTCTFANTKSTTLTITKVAQPNDPQDFEFTTTGSGLPPTITLDDDAAPGGPPNSVTYSVTPGVTYTVTETQVTGWTTNSIQCIPDVTGSSQSTNSATRKATVNLDPGTNMTCTFTNTKTN